MAADTAAKLQKVKKYSASLRNLFGFLFVIGLLGWFVRTIMMWSDAKPHEPSLVRIGHLVYSGDAVSTDVRVLSYVYFTLAVAISLKITFHLIKLFALYAEGKIFSAENVGQIRQIGFTMLFSPALFFLTLFVPLFVAAEGTISQGGQGAVLGVGGVFEQIIVGTIILIFSWIMDVGRELREEQDLVV
jgi:hypothetical protein